MEPDARASPDADGARSGDEDKDRKRTSHTTRKFNV
jgi:hypothetical protein